MDRITDWRGNEIKGGDTVITVATKPLFSEMHLYELGEEKGTILSSAKFPEHIWEPQTEYEIISKDDWIGCKTTVFYNQIETTMISSIESLSADLLQRGVILCIKGVSDNEQDYYTEYFRV